MATPQQVAQLSDRRGNTDYREPIPNDETAPRRGSIKVQGKGKTLKVWAAVYHQPPGLP